MLVASGTLTSPRDSEPESPSQALRLGYEKYAESWGRGSLCWRLLPVLSINYPSSVSQTSTRGRRGGTLSAGLPGFPGPEVIGRFTRPSDNEDG